MKIKNKCLLLCFKKSNLVIYILLLVNFLVISCAELNKFFPALEPSKPVVYLDINEILNKNKLEEEKLSKDRNIINLEKGTSIMAKVKILDVSKKEYKSTLDDCIKFLYTIPGKNYRLDIQYGSEVEFTPGLNKCLIIDSKYNKDYYILPGKQFYVTTENIDKNNRFVIVWHSKPIVVNNIFDSKARKESIKNYYKFFENLQKGQIILGKGTIFYKIDILDQDLSSYKGDIYHILFDTNLEIPEK